MAGYSTTPLAKKLGIKEGHVVYFPSAPPNFLGLLAPLAGRTSIVQESRHELDLIVFFTKSSTELSTRFVELARLLRPAGILWISWPKKTSGVPTDLHENLIREIGLSNGLVDTKVCAIDDVWSGLKFVYRLEDRPKRTTIRGGPSPVP